MVHLRRTPQAAALPISGGQGVAGSNPVVPTAVESPLFLTVIPGQRAFLSRVVPVGVDLGGEGAGTICGPSVDTARCFESTTVTFEAAWRTRL